jgi:hypothetical protein
MDRARKEDKNMLCKNRITLIGFLGQQAEMRYTSSGNAYTRFSIATRVSWKARKPANTNHARSGTESLAGTSWASGPPSYRKARTLKSRGNYVTESSRPRNRITVCALPKSMPARSFCWTAPTGNRLPKPPTQSLWRNQPIKPISRAWVRIDARRFRR